MYFVLIRAVKTLHKPTSTVSISLCKMQIFYQHSLIEDKEELNKKIDLPVPMSFPFLLGHHFQPK